MKQIALAIIMILVTAPLWASPDISGWGQFRYSYGSNTDTALPANARLLIKQQVNPKLLLQLLPDLSSSGAGFSMLDAFAEYKLCDSTRDRKSTRLNSSHSDRSRMPSSA